MRKALRKQEDAIVSVYELDEEKLTQYKTLQFKEDNKEWLDFVCRCRRGEFAYQQYDIIIGSVADDDVFQTIDMYFKGIWDADRALKELVYYKLNDQICIVNQETLKEILSFKEAYTMGAPHLQFKISAKTLCYKGFGTYFLSAFL